jgi:hypothetical protein
MDISKFLKDEKLDAKWYGIPDTDVQVQIRNIKPQRRSELVRKCTTTKVKRGRADRTIDDTKLNQLYIRECVVGWRGIKEGDEDFPFSEENAIALDQNWPAFNALWNDVIENLSTTADAVEELDEGKSGSGESST